MTTASQTLPRIHLLPGRDKRVAHGHPWIYSNEIRMDAEAKALPAGSIVTLHRVDGKAMGVGTFNSRSLICFRLFDRDAGRVVNAGFIAERVERARALRDRLFDAPFYRLIHGEADGLPGLVVDRFGGVLVVQTATAGMDALLPQVLEALDGVLGPEVVVLRNDGAFRALEDLPSQVEVVRGAVSGPVEVREGAVIFLADVLEGQKTGWFFDQRASRAFVARLARGGTMLDVFCHGGGFALHAAVAGARAVTAVDSSERALDLAARSARSNGVEGGCSFIHGDAFDTMERLATQPGRFQVVAADPPAFVKSRKDLKTGLKGYRKVARLAAALVEPGGFLFLASCSHNVTAEAFADESARGLQGAARSGRLLRASGAGPDHPVHPWLPESAYLKTLVYQLD